MSKVTIDRELLEHMRNFTVMHDSGVAGVLRGQIDAILARPIQQGEAVEVVGYTFFHVDHGWIFRNKPIYEGNPSLEAFSVMRCAQHKRIVAQRDAENARLRAELEQSRDLIVEMSKHCNATALVADWLERSQ